MIFWGCVCRGWGKWGGIGGKEVVDDFFFLRFYVGLLGPGGLVVLLVWSCGAGDGYDDHACAIG